MVLIIPINKYIFDVMYQIALPIYIYIIYLKLEKRTMYQI